MKLKFPFIAIAVIIAVAACFLTYEYFSYEKGGQIYRNIFQLGSTKSSIGASAWFYVCTPAQKYNYPGIGKNYHYLALSKESGSFFSLQFHIRDQKFTLDIPVG